MYCVKHGNAWEAFAPAKVNLYLEVLGSRPDGYHELETLMAPIRVYDELRWLPPKPGSQPGAVLRVRTVGAADQVPADHRNLVFRAVELFARRAGIEPRGTFALLKRIPSQAGLGGGSSDAAAALVLTAAAWQIDYSRQRLMEIASELGSDVAFFLQPRTAVCRGRGEIVEPLSRLPRLHFVVVKPSVGIATPEAFRQLAAQGCAANEAAESRRKLGNLVEALRRGALAEAGRWMINRFQSAVEELTDVSDRIGRALVQCGCLAQVMSGSGSACLGLVRSAREARAVGARLAGMNLGKVWTTASG